MELDEGPRGYFQGFAKLSLFAGSIQPRYNLNHMLRIELRVLKHFVAARGHRAIDVIPFTLHNPTFIDVEAPSGDDKFTRLNLLFGDKSKRDTNGATSTRMCELSAVLTDTRVLKSITFFFPL